MTHKKKGRVGSSFDDSLAEQAFWKSARNKPSNRSSPIRSKRHGEGPPHQGGHGHPHANQPQSARPFARFPLIRALHCTLFNALLWLSAASSGWNLSETANTSSLTALGSHKRPSVERSSRAPADDFARAARYAGLKGDMCAITKKMVVSNPGVMMGKPVIAGTRITVELILENGRWRNC